MCVFTGTTPWAAGCWGAELREVGHKTRDVSSKKLGFSPESNGELLEDLKMGEGKGLSGGGRLSVALARRMRGAMLL